MHGIKSKRLGSASSLVTLNPYPSFKADVGATWVMYGRESTRVVHSTRDRSDDIDRKGASKMVIFPSLAFDDEIICRGTEAYSAVHRRPIILVFNTLAYLPRERNKTPINEKVVLILVLVLCSAYISK